MSAYTPDVAAIRARLDRVMAQLPAARAAIAEAYPAAPSHLREPLARALAELEADKALQDEHRRGREAGRLVNFTERHPSGFYRDAA